MSYSTTNPFNSILGRRTFSGIEDTTPEETAKRARVDIPPNLILDTLTHDLLQNVMEFNGNLNASRVSKDFNNANAAALKRVWQELEENFTVREDLRAARFLERIDPNLTEFQRAKILYDRMTGELEILDSNKLRELSPISRKFDQKLYIEIAQHLKQISNLALTLSWPRIQNAIMRQQHAHENPHMPSVQAPADEIRAWISSPNNQTILRRIASLNFNNLGLPVIPDEIKYFKNIQTINLSENKIQGINSSTFKGLLRLRTVVLSKNRINQIPEDLFVDNQMLERVFLKHNRLRQIPEKVFRGLEFLEHVELDSNQIEEIPSTLFTNCNNLIGFYISHNRLREIPEDLFAQPNTAIEFVDFSNNLISEIPTHLFNEAQELQSAIFYENRIQRIQTNLFSKCFDLRYLDLSENLIESICPEFCENCSAFPELFLANNPITQDPDGYFRRFNHPSGGLFEA